MTTAFGDRPLANASTGSLLSAAEQLRAAVAAADSPEWAADVRRALRACTLAVEHHFDLMARADGLGGEIAAHEPRLIHELEQLEGKLAKLLVEFWETKSWPAEAREALTARLDTLVTDLRHAGDHEFKLATELEMTPPSAVD
ncbi:MAG: hypothetical protein IT303_12000 [Dehalococcoidia bacterium]|nr:hypothetical protein [Dehalococcoidia bacterium]